MNFRIAPKSSFATLAAFLAAVTAACLWAPPSAAASDMLKPADISTYDGKSWSGLVLEGTTREALLKSFKCEKAKRDSALITLSHPKNADATVEAWFGSADKAAPLAAISVSFPKGFDLDAVRHASSEAGEDRYADSRLDDWRLVLFTGKGMAALVLRETGRESVARLLLTTPARLAALRSALKTEVTALPTPEKVAELSQPRVGEFGSVSCTFDVRGIKMDEERDRADWEARMRRATAGGTIRYREGARGSYSLKISGTYNATSGGMFSVACSLLCDVPGDLVTGSDYTSFQMPGSQPGTNGVLGGLGSVGYTLSVVNCMKKTEGDVAKAMHSLNPSPVESRERAWAELVRGCASNQTAAAGSSSAGGSILTSTQLPPDVEMRLRKAGRDPAEYTPAAITRRSVATATEILGISAEQQTLLSDLFLPFAGANRARTDADTRSGAVRLMRALLTPEQKAKADTIISGEPKETYAEWVCAITAPKERDREKVVASAEVLRSIRVSMRQSTGELTRDRMLELGKQLMASRSTIQKAAGLNSVDQLIRSQLVIDTLFAE